MLPVAAQVDPHFSQYYAYPLWLNPALTGAIDGDYRLSANYKNQWNGVMDAFSTVGISGDFVTNKSLNLGMNILSQAAGDAGYHYNTGYISAAFTGIKFGYSGYQRLVLGLQAGLINRNFNLSKFKLGDQWNPVTGYSPSNPTSDVFTRSSSTAFDAGAGALFYDGDPDKAMNLFAGFSAFHLTRPEDPFVFGDKRNLPIRWTVHGGARFAMSEVVNFVPNFLYVRQGNAEEKILGGYAELKADTYTDLLLGGSYRFQDAFIAFAGFRYNNMVLGLSYDATTSSLKNYARGNSFELSISFIGRKARVFPEEYFVCPRL